MGMRPQCALPLPMGEVPPQGAERALSVTAYNLPAPPEGEPSTSFRIRLTFPKKETHCCRAVGDIRPYGRREVPLFIFKYPEGIPSLSIIDCQLSIQ